MNVAKAWIADGKRLGSAARSLEQIGTSVMSRVCQVTGMGPLSGNNVSHANNKTRRRYLPNLQSHRIWVDSEQRFVTLRVSCRGLRTIDKRGIDAVLKDLRARGQQV